MYYYMNDRIYEKQGHSVSTYTIEGSPIRPRATKILYYGSLGNATPLKIVKAKAFLTRLDNFSKLDAKLNMSYTQMCLRGCVCKAMLLGISNSLSATLTCRVAVGRYSILPDKVEVTNLTVGDGIGARTPIPNREVSSDDVDLLVESLDAEYEDLVIPQELPRSEPAGFIPWRLDWGMVSWSGDYQ